MSYRPEGCNILFSDPLAAIANRYRDGIRESKHGKRVWPYNAVQQNQCKQGI